MIDVAAVYPEWVELSEGEKAILADEGMESVKVLRVRGMDRLLEGMSVGGDTLRGWYRDGQAIIDISWEIEQIDGWPESVRI